MKDWHVYVVMGVIAFVFVDVVLLPNGSILISIGRVLVEMLMRIG